MLNGPDARPEALSEAIAQKTGVAGPMPTGLTSAEARRRLADVGPNAVPEERPSALATLLEKFWGPVPWLLEAAIVVQLTLGAWVEAGVVGGLLLFNATLGVVQQGRASTALAVLKPRLAPIALVLRDGAWGRRPADELVPGDVIRVPLGALVPADARVLSGSVLVDQSMLTGESLPVEAAADSLLYAGSLVRRGQAIAEVTATGARTSFGRAAELVRLAHARSTEQAAILGVTWGLALVNGGVALLLVLAAAALGWPFVDVVRLALTALLASIPVALPATFALSAAIGAQALARRGVLLTRLSAAHEAAAMDLLCADKTGTLTRNALEVADVVAMAGFDRDRVLTLAALASSEADQDVIDATIRRSAATAPGRDHLPRLVRFIPFDPATRMAEAVAVDRDGHELRIAKGAFEAMADTAETPMEARRLADDLAGRGYRVLAVAAGSPPSLRLAGLIALSDPPREDAARLVAALRAVGVRTVMVTGDSPVTAASVAGQVGIDGAICPPERLAEQPGVEEFGVFARVVPAEKYRLVKSLQGHGHVVGMCGDGVNDAPALRQAQIGIAVASATDVAKAAAGLVLTKPGLAGVLAAVTEGRIAFQRLLTFAFNMLIKKIEIVLFLAIGLALTGQAVLTPALMVLMLITNDVLAMSLTTDRATPARSPAVWRMRRITAAAMILAAGKLGFSTAMLAFGRVQLGLNPGQLQTLALVTLVFGSQALLYVVRERRRLWASRPGVWVLAASVADVSLVSGLAWSGVLMDPLPGDVLVALLAAAGVFALLLDRIKLAVIRVFGP
jgi:H+-transporting ATPase